MLAVATNVNEYVLQANGDTPDIPSVAEFLQVVKTASYYNFEAIPHAGDVRSIIFEVFDTSERLSTSTTILTVKSGELTTKCTQTETDADVIFFVDSSSASTFGFWKSVQSFLSRSLLDLTVTSRNIRFSI